MPRDQNQNKSSMEPVRESQMWKSGSPRLSGKPGTWHVGGRDGLLRVGLDGVGAYTAGGFRARVLGTVRDSLGRGNAVHFLLCPASELTCIQPCPNQTGLSPPVPSLGPASLASHLTQHYQVPPYHILHVSSESGPESYTPFIVVFSTSPTSTYLNALCPRPLHKAPPLSAGNAASRVCSDPPFILKWMSDSHL